jgi:lantibiotic leader peptide-processing serine protease
MRMVVRLVVGILLITLGATALPRRTMPPAKADDSKQYIVVGLGNQLPDHFGDLVASVGGELIDQSDEIGVAVVQSSDPAFQSALASIAGLRGVVENRPVAFTPPDTDAIILDGADTNTGLAPFDPATAQYFFAQWGMRDIGADDAWHLLGAKGSPRVKVAVIDTGIDDTQRELAGKVDQVLSHAFFTEALPPGVTAAMVKTWTDFHGHGTHIAGIVAGSGFKVAGVAPGVTLIAVKVAGRNGFANWGTIIKAIIYAADAGANVINMSFGERFAEDSPGLDQLEEALQRAINYAFKKGAVLVASAGNERINWDQIDDMVRLPAQMEHVLGVSAVGPTYGTNPDALATYSDFGTSIVTFAAPGGNNTPYRCMPLDERGLPLVTGRMAGCMQLPPLANGKPEPKGMPLDSVLSACSRFLYVRNLNVSPTDALNFPCMFKTSIFMLGTSMAAAHVSGVAALAASAAGSTNPTEILEILRRSADHLGQPGKNAQYGFGRVNAYRAVLYATQQAATRTSEIADNQQETAHP